MLFLQEKEFTECRSDRERDEARVCFFFSFFNQDKIVFVIDDESRKAAEEITHFATTAPFVELTLRFQNHTLLFIFLRYPHPRFSPNALFTPRPRYANFYIKLLSLYTLASLLCGYGLCGTKRCKGPSHRGSAVSCLFCFQALMYVCVKSCRKNKPPVCFRFSRGTYSYFGRVVASISLGCCGSFDFYFLEGRMKSFVCEIE